MRYTEPAELFKMHGNNNFDQERSMSMYPSLPTPPSDSPETYQMLSPLANTSQNLYIPAQGYVPQYDVGQATRFLQDNAYLKILEQPVDKFRFRYKSEMAGTHGSLTGKAADRGRKQTYPTVQLCNFKKPAIVRCSVYQFSTDDYEDSQPHAHRLVRKSGSMEMDDPHDLRVCAENDYIAGFHSMGIIHTARKNIISELTRKKALLKEEENARVEGGKRTLTAEELVEIQNEAENESKKINLNIVRLRFDAFEDRNGILYPICRPVYTHSINNLKSALTGDLKIVRMDHCTSPCRGNREIFILVEKVTKKNIKIRFFELDDEETIWEDYGKFTDLDVHHQYAIVFRTPPYRDLNIDQQVKVYMELIRPLDGARSEPKDFIYTPCDPVSGRKRPRSSYSSGSSYSSLCEYVDIPLTINDCAEGENVLKSEELEEALRMNNINSSEIEKLFKTYGEHYKNLDFENMEDAGELATDTPVAQSETAYSTVQTMPESNDYRALTTKEKELLSRVYRELSSFLKTNPPLDRKLKMALFLFSNLRSENGDTALHLSLYSQSERLLKLFMQMLRECPHSDIINAKNNTGDTLLHVAVDMGAVPVVSILIGLKADMCLQNDDGNTPLHLVVKKQASSNAQKQTKMHILNYLLKDEAILPKFIDLENNAGNSALTIAIEANNLDVVKKLCWRGADVNKCNKKNGFTALHMAVNQQNYDIVNFLLDIKSTQLQIFDFKDYTPYRLATSLKSSSRNGRRICERIEEYMRKNGLSEIVEIKEEFPDDLSDSEHELKLEPMSPANSEMEDSELTEKVFTSKCLEEVAGLLDKSGNWENLAELLDLGHFLRIEDISKYSSPSRGLLKLAIAHGEKVSRIRDFLENLDEKEAVDAIDRMIKKEVEEEV